MSITGCRDLQWSLVGVGGRAVVLYYPQSIDNDNWREQERRLQTRHSIVVHHLRRSSGSPDVLTGNQTACSGSNGTHWIERFGANSLSKERRAQSRWKGVIFDRPEDARQGRARTVSLSAEASLESLTARGRLNQSEGLRIDEETS